MGLFDYVKSQLLDVIEWEDSSQNTIVHKIDMRNNEIQNSYRKLRKLQFPS